MDLNILDIAIVIWILSILGDVNKAIHYAFVMLQPLWQTAASGYFYHSRILLINTKITNTIL